MRVDDIPVGFDVAESAEPSSDERSGARWLAAMLEGDFVSAWNESDSIRRRGRPDPHRLWMGEDVRGKRVIVRCLHGFGDAVQMLRFMPRLRALAENVTVEVPPRMLALAPLLEGVTELITWGEMAPETPPTWEVQVEIMELPYLLRITKEELPVAAAYLRVPVAEVAEAAALMGHADELRVGLVWAGGEWNPTRSMPVECVARLVQSGGAQFWSLQGGAAREQAGALVRDGRLCDAAVCGDGLRVLAGVVANLDLVITVDTLAAHLAGAMGKPVWVLLQHGADWRWMTNRLDSPWYPGMRLFRQSVEGNWDGVVEAVTAELQQLIRGAATTEHVW